LPVRTPDTGNKRHLAVAGSRQPGSRSDPAFGWQASFSVRKFSRCSGVEPTVGNTMIYLILGLIVIELFFQVRARTAVIGSRQRYVSLSLRRLTNWAINLAFIAEGLIFLSTNQFSEALWYLAFGIIGIVLELRAHHDDDDWFNGRGKKIKAGLRRLMSRPRRQYAPSFG
jgi:hypothetical protein